MQGYIRTSFRLVPATIQFWAIPETIEKKVRSTFSDQVLSLRQSLITFAGSLMNLVDEFDFYKSEAGILRSDDR
jgi:hypothetical protein